MNRKTKRSVFQVMLLDNDDSQDVEVQESENVDFYHVKEHLKHGGSVFITSNAAQKLSIPKNRSQHNYNRSRRAIGLLFRQQMRS
jgi:hypothetical protein